MSTNLIEIKPSGPLHAVAAPPPSKAETLRGLIIGALGDGLTVLDEPLFADDSRVLMDALRALGFDVRADKEKKHIDIYGQSGRIPARDATLDAGESGAAMRFLLPMLALGDGTYRLDGSKRLSERPLSELIRSLRALGVDIEDTNGHLPVTVNARGVTGGRVSLDASRSSQFASALLMSAPCFADGFELELAGEPVSRPYIETTIRMMDAFGVPVERDGDCFRVMPGKYSGRGFRIGPDASAASYFLAAAAVTGGSVTLRGVGTGPLRGDWVFAEILELMGCTIKRIGDDLTLHGRPLRGVTVDMRDTPDLVPSLAAVAPFADGWTRINGIAHLRLKESDRIGVLARELSALGVKVETAHDTLALNGPPVRGGTVNPDGDHRIAMALAILGLKLPGLRIINADCVNKSFPDFFTELEKITSGAL
jgi:3-phosphoshikimate 1-carboxyvinyltransferase